MNLRISATVLVVVAAAFFLIGSASARKGASLHKTTMENLSTAMHGEAFAYAKYSLYAEHARKTGEPDVAKLFEDAAKTEHLEHFAEEARLAGVVGTNAENLQNAIQGESYEVDTMYRNFAQQAASVGDKEVADRFEEIRRDEMKHRDAFKAALANVQKTAAANQ